MRGQTSATSSPVVVTNETGEEFSLKTTQKGCVCVNMMCVHPQYSTQKSTPMEKVATNSNAGFQDLPPAYKDIYKL